MTDNIPGSSCNREWTDCIELLKSAVADAIDRGSFNREGVYRIEEEIPYTDPLLWLKGRSHSIKLFFTDRDRDLITAGIGVAVDFREPHTDIHRRIDEILANSSSDVKFYGGEAFPVYRNSPEWQNFGTKRYIVPVFEISIRDGRAYLACNIYKNSKKEAILKELDQLEGMGKFHASVPEKIKTVSEPEYSEWERGIESALRSIRLGDYEKIVLAARRTLTFKESPDPYYILRELLNLPNSRYNFLFDFEGAVFAGSSPERLYKRSGNNIVSEAVAGTVSRGDNPDEDSVLGFSLMSSDKDLREHDYVVKAVKEKLEFIGEDVTVSADNNLLKLTEGQHLKKTLRATLREDFSEEVIIRALHPTPAVGGYPGTEFLDDIGRIEGFERGWYAGAVGYRGFEDSDFAVGIRSFMALGKDIHLYGGVGVVEGSSAEAEWEESNLKLSNLLKILNKEI